MRKGVAFLTALLLALSSAPAYGEAYTEKTYIGSLAAEFSAEDRIGDTSLGILAADAYLEACPDAVISLTLRREYTGSLPSGALVWGDILQVFPEEQPLCTAKITAAQLKAALEVCLAGIVTDEKGNSFLGEGKESFFCPGGFSVRIDTFQPAGNRVKSIKLNNGAEAPLDNDYIPLTLAAHPETMALLFPGTEVLPADRTPGEAVADFLSGEQQYAPRITNRITLAARGPEMWVLITAAGCGSLVIVSLMLFLFRRNRKKARL